MKNSLLVDRDQQTMLHKTLESAGFLVFDISEAGRDQDRLRRHWAAVNLLDLRAPRMRGLQITTSDGPELIVVTHGSIAETFTALNFGATKILAKPLTSEALRTAIEEILSPLARLQPYVVSPPNFVAVEPTITDLVRAKQALDRREFGEALRLVSWAINRHPDSAVAHHLMGALHLRLGENAAAYHSFQLALRAEWAYEALVRKSTLQGKGFGPDSHLDGLIPVAQRRDPAIDHGPSNE
jgi:DNA-binding response OmpR family regulator